MFWQDVGNVIAFSHACKGNFGSNRNCSANLVIAPELRDAYGSHASGAAPCGEEVNNGHGSTFANKWVLTGQRWHLCSELSSSVASDGGCSRQVL